MARENLFGPSSDALTTEMDVPASARSVVVKFGDEFRSSKDPYIVNGWVEYYNGKTWAKLKTYRDLRRTAPYVCLTVNPQYHKRLRFNLSVIGGKFSGTSFRSHDCRKVSQEENQQIEEEQEKKEREKARKKGFLEQLNDLIRSVGLILVLILALLLIAGAVALFLWLKGMLPL